jgi:hypothetical protein
MKRKEYVYEHYENLVNPICSKAVQVFYFILALSIYIILSLCSYHRDMSKDFCCMKEVDRLQYTTRISHKYVHFLIFEQISTETVIFISNDNFLQVCAL